MEKENVKRTKRDALQSFLEENSDIILVNDMFWCKTCGFSLKYNKKSGLQNIKTHLISQSHIICTDTRIFHEGVKNEYGMNDYYIHEQLAIAFYSCNIPISVVENPKMGQFFRLLGVTLKNRKFYSENVANELARKRNEHIYQHFRGKQVVLRFDETTDAARRQVLAVQVSELNCDQYRKPVTIFCDQIDNTTSETVAAVINSVLDVIMPTVEEKNNLRGLISDGAAYCRKVGKILKEKYKRCIHIICLCHNLHNMAGYMRKNLPIFSNICDFLAKIFKISQHNRNLWSEYTSLPAFPSYCLTRWGSWLSCALWVSDNIVKVDQFLKFFNQKIPVEKRLNLDYSLLDQEIELLESYRFLPSSITYLESEGLTFTQQMDVYYKVFNNLKYEFDIAKFKYIMEKNPDFIGLCEEFKKKKNCSKNIYNYMDCTNSGVERLFSKYNSILTPERRRLNINSIFNIIMMSELDFNI